MHNKCPICYRNFESIRTEGFSGQTSEEYLKCISHDHEYEYNFAHGHSEEIIGDFTISRSWQDSNSDKEFKDMISDMAVDYLKEKLGQPKIHQNIAQWIEDWRNFPFKNDEEILEEASLSIYIKVLEILRENPEKFLKAYHNGYIIEKY